MVIHFLTGDSLAYSFSKTNIEGEVLVSRECLLDGPINSNNLEEFWQMRAVFIHATFEEQEAIYYQKVAAEFKALQALSLNDEVNLWFEYDLFCQTNMWFSLHLLHQNSAKPSIYRVHPAVLSESNRWNGFGRMDAEDLKACLANRVQFEPGDITLGNALWLAYQNNDLTSLENLSQTQSPCFPYLSEVCQAEIDRKMKQRPQKTLQNIIANGATDFSQIFIRFSEQQGVYGFGDLQVKLMLEDQGIGQDI